MKKQLLITWAVFFCALVALAFWSHHDAKAQATAAVAKQEQKNLRFWKSKLVTIYKDCGIKHAEKPTTRDEIFGPLFGLMQKMEQ